MLAASIPGMLAGAWLVTQADPRLLQLLVGVIVLAGAVVQALASGRPATPRRLRATAGRWRSAAASPPGRSPRR